MLTPHFVQDLLSDLESDRIERTVSTNNTDKFAETVCAFANDYPYHRRPGYEIQRAGELLRASAGNAAAAGAFLI